MGLQHKYCNRMKYNFLIVFICVWILCNVSFSYSETCSSCPYLEQCEVIICGSVYVDGHMTPDFVSGCSLDCPIGVIECKLTNQNKLAWHPVDPCLVTTTTPNTTTTTTTTSTTTTTTTTTLIVTLPQIIESSKPITNYTPTINKTNKNESIHDDTRTNVTIVNISTISPKDSLKYSTVSLSSNSTHDLWDKTSSKPFSRWILIWLIPVLVAVAVILCLIFCFIAIHHHKRTRDKVHLNRRKQDSRYDQLVLNTIGSNGNGHRTNSSTYLAGTLNKASNESETNGSPKHANLNGMLSTKRNQRETLKKRSKTLKTFKRKHSTSKSGTERRVINWQDMGTHEFVTPPSPRSATGHRLNRHQSGSLAFTQKRPSSSLSQSSSAFKAPASVYPLRRSPSPLSCQFGEVQSMVQSSVYDSQPLSGYSETYDHCHVVDENLTITGSMAFRDTLNYYPTGDESDKHIRGTCLSKSAHELLSHSDEQASTLIGPYNYTLFNPQMNTPSAFNSKDLSVYQPSRSIIQSNVGESSPRIPRV